jgi:hypothetical protein
MKGCGLPFQSVIQARMSVQVDVVDTEQPRTVKQAVGDVPVVSGVGGAWAERRIYGAAY